VACLNSPRFRLISILFCSLFSNKSAERPSVDAIRSGTIGALYSVSTAFGYGALAGFVVCRLAHALAKHHNTQSQDRLSVDEQAYRLLIETLCSGSTEFKGVLAATAPRWLPANRQVLADAPRTLPSSIKSLSTSVRTLNADSVALPDQAHELSSRPFTLPDEPSGLSEIYRSALSSLASSQNKKLR
jgi:hypothetical protein